MERLRKLFAPMGVEQFFDEVWQQRAYHFRGHPDRHVEIFPELASREKLAEVWNT